LLTSKCLRKFCIDLNTIQLSLNIIFDDTIYLRKNIIRICINNSILIKIFINISLNIFALINDLYINIVNYEVIQKNSQTYIQNNEDSTFFIDRQYRDNSRFRRSSYNKIFSRTASRSKKCFVCDKSKFWLTNHTQKKRDDLKKCFSKHFLKYKSNYIM
jgi:hypothetical protein